MAASEGNWWSRAWGTVAVLGFALGLGASLYEAVLVAPLWSWSPPQSVAAWVALAAKPDSAILFDPLVVLTLVAATMAWLSGIATRGWRRWWLTLTLAAAAAWAVVTFALMLPCERQLFGGAWLEDGNAAFVIAQIGEWIRIAAYRFAALLLGVWAAYRAQLSGMLGGFPATRGGEADEAVGPRTRRRREPEFSFGDEDPRPRGAASEGPTARAKWQSTLPKRQRTAKK